MLHQLMKLPYGLNALEPYISRETLRYHHGKHHRAYVEKLNELIAGTEFENLALEEVIRKASGPIFNNAAQVWNHDFYWHCLAPDAPRLPGGELAEAIDKSFGSFDNFAAKFGQAAIDTFGSGWAWLVRRDDTTLAIVSTGNADNPVKSGDQALLTCDVWEHAYYIDQRNKRPDYVKAFWRLVDWNFVERRYRGTQQPAGAAKSASLGAHA
jgi:superoxide dismutase, Fe-Mn family